jgi:predicted SAM-dependent methyltransferase
MLSSVVRAPFRLTKRMIKSGPEALRRRKSLELLKGASKLHLGCGSHLLQGWANINPDIPGAVDCDLRYPLPIPDGSIDFIYSQHFIEHLARDDGVRHLRDCHRVLRAGGVLRLSTPNLRYLAETYLAGNVKEWLTEPEFWNPRTPAQMLNDALRLWGHEFVYDFDEMSGALREIGFSGVIPETRGNSKYSALRGLETRPDHRDLIIEATR